MSAYWIAHVTITNPEQYAKYMSLAPSAFEKYNAKFLVRGGNSMNLEGKKYARHVIIEFPDLETAKACYYSAEYTEARIAREGCAEVMISLVEKL